jgi:hypothetical protein
MWYSLVMSMSPFCHLRTVTFNGNCIPLFLGCFVFCFFVVVAFCLMLTNVEIYLLSKNLEWKDPILPNCKGGSKEWPLYSKPQDSYVPLVRTPRVTISTIEIFYKRFGKEVGSERNRDSCRYSDCPRAGRPGFYSRQRQDIFFNNISGE